jgi:hypothetical protein
MIRMRLIKLEINVEVPDNTPDMAVLTAIDAALDEPPCDWGDWTVGAAAIVHDEGA